MTLTTVTTSKATRPPARPPTRAPQRLSEHFGSADRLKASEGNREGRTDAAMEGD